jgi:hypothetical protein
LIAFEKTAGKRNEERYSSSTGLKARLEVDLDKAAETG